jgi:hypothetical protein
MGNHYHMLIETPEANLVSGMGWLQNTYTRRFNVRHRAWGRLFGDRYKAVLVESDGYYFETLLDYIHLNPVRAGLVKPLSGQSVMDYPWSSVAGGYALAPRSRVKWFAAESGLAVLGLNDTTGGRRRFVERLDGRAVDEGMERAGIPPVDSEKDRRCSHLRRGWCWGSQEFAERVLRLGETVLGKKRHRCYKASLESRAHGEKEAVRLLAEGLEKARLTARDLPKLRGSDGRKVGIALEIWEKTTMNMNWIAEKLWMKSAANVSQQIGREQKKRRGRK